MPESLINIPLNAAQVSSDMFTMPLESFPSHEPSVYQSTTLERRNSRTGNLTTSNTQREATFTFNISGNRINKQAPLMADMKEGLDWEPMLPAIRDLYLQQRLPLAKVIQVMEAEYHLKLRKYWFDLISESMHKVHLEQRQS